MKSSTYLYVFQFDSQCNILSESGDLYSATPRSDTVYISDDQCAYVRLYMDNDNIDAARERARSMLERYIWRKMEGLA